MKNLYEGIPMILESRHLQKYTQIMQLDPSTRDSATPHPAEVKRELNLNGVWAQIIELVGLTHLLLILRSFLKAQGNLMARHLRDAVM